MFSLHSIEERLDGGIVVVVQRDTDALPACGRHLVRGLKNSPWERLFEDLWPVTLGLRSSGHVDGRAGRSKLERDTLADASARARNYGDPAG